MQSLITGVLVGFASISTGVAIGLRWRKIENRDLRAQRDDAYQRIDAIRIRPEPKQ
jgi:hypothetical protein